MPRGHGFDSGHRHVFRGFWVDVGYGFVMCFTVVVSGSLGVMVSVAGGCA